MVPPGVVKVGDPVAAATMGGGRVSVPAGLQDRPAELTQSLDFLLEFQDLCLLLLGARVCHRLQAPGPTATDPTATGTRITNRRQLRIHSQLLIY
eukprot:SAG22_NODE_2966_length_2064_cov_42.721120_3_plen_95_part_00